jgi:hypothetical protein
MPSGGKAGPVVGLAGGTQAGKRQMIYVHLEMFLLLNLGEPALDGAVIQREDPIAFAARQVVMRHLARDLIVSVTPNPGRSDQAQVTQEIQRAVNRGPVNRRRLVMHTLKDFLWCGVAIPFTNGIQNELPLGSDAKPLFVEKASIVAGKMCHAHPRYYELSQQRTLIIAECTESWRG